MSSSSNATATAARLERYASFAGEDTLTRTAHVPTVLLRAAQVPSVLEAQPRTTSSARVLASGGFCVLPSGFVCAVPEDGRIVTVAMDHGWLVHLERDGDDGALVTVEPPSSVAPPADDVALASLAVDSRASATGDDSVDRQSESASALRRAWSYRRAFERLAEGWPGDGGPVVPVRWLTLSYEGRVHVPGVGTLSLDDDDDDAVLCAADGRRVRVRALDDDSAPRGTIEIIVEAAILPAAVPPPTLSSTARGPAIRTSPRCIRLDD